MLSTLLRRLTFALTTVVYLWLPPLAALAQKGGKQEVKPKSFAPNWMLLVLLVALCLFAVCKPTFREDKPKPRYD